jgi:hypothetical protein
MKTLIVILLCPAVMAANVLAGAGSGPWADGAYYPGGLDGKYMGIVTGNNISGVLGFGISQGAPPFRETEQQSGQEGVLAVNQQFGVDPLQNYFAIFVEGRTYTGLTIAGINIASKSVAGALQGQNPVAVPAAGGPGGTLDFTSRDALSIVNRGLSGGFTAKVKKNKGVFTFKGDGQLSTPANDQSYTVSASGGPSGETVSGSYKTDSSHFSISGIRTSLFSSNPALLRDAAQGGGAGGN